MGKRVLITGDRNWTDRQAIKAWLTWLKTIGYDTLIEGEARGADTIARQEGEALGYVIEPYPAQWDKYGRAAGPIRNRQMVTEGNPGIVVYFHCDLANSKGTRDMVNYAESCEIPVYKGGSESNVQINS